MVKGPERTPAKSTRCPQFLVRKVSTSTTLLFLTGFTSRKEQMLKCWRLSVAKQATTFATSAMKFKNTKPRPVAPLGSRILTSTDDIFKHNMWDHVEWTDEDKEDARKKAQENSHEQIPAAEKGKFDADACQYWDKFYEIHQNKFFKDRRWLFLEFPELLYPSLKEDHGKNVHHQSEVIQIQSGCTANTETRHYQHNDPTEDSWKMNNFNFQGEQGPKEVSFYPGYDASFRILEVGCGVGNSVFPILNNIRNTDSFLYCCDFSSRAIQIVKEHQDYDDSICHAFVHDICEEGSSFPFPLQSLDVILAVFVLSSIHPERLQGVVNRLSSYLKPGGMFLFRDYGRYDFSQLRFKKGRCLSENFYTRGDGTCVYYFTEEEVGDLFSKAGLEQIQNLEDRRLQVNRKKKVAMRRVWMQSKFRKPNPEHSPHHCCS
ncbi:mRNA N(3)-methylcytidine methyltransferase METTL8 isoform X1 [Oryzias melastigma]|uniref:mRNA N(3)-methylcytidine methyltransferase METTL8 isoform X1 n=1 Tax=Oryzias melastigma TaxID=30732 RepID=UPI000CF7B767|nr:mRNA N(3)-methylcytidine methyltransferase METTL8 isoform X1 [Oryzias melastigma]